MVALFRSWSADPLAVEGLGYSVGGRELFAGLDLRVPDGESVAVLGPSGCGKSTLLSIVLGLVRPSAGSVLVGGTEVVGLHGNALARLRADRIGMVFQFGELLPELSPVENVVLAGLLARRDRSGLEDRARDLLGELGVPDATTSATLSGGERQRVAVARALINEPGLLLADEPTGALDAAARDVVAELLFALPVRYGCGLVVVTHDVATAQRADRVLRLDAGALVATGDEASIA